MELLGNLLEIFTNNWEIWMPPLWVGLAVYIAWYVTSAKRVAPLTLKEARVLWKIHKQKAQCEAKKCWRIMRKNRIVGFECGCGHKYVQKRPII